MLAEMTNPELVDHILTMPGATDAERELAERLFFAVGEMDRLVQEIQRLEAGDGSDAGG